MKNVSIFVYKKGSMVNSMWLVVIIVDLLIDIYSVCILIDR